MNDRFLRGRKVLVTGGAKGLGRAMALALAKRGARVLVHYRSSEREAKALLRVLRRFDRRAAIYRADLRDETETRVMMAAVRADHGALDALVNNVGNFIYTPIEWTTFAQFCDVIETNLSASFLCSHLALAAMRAEKKKGQIVNFGCAGADRLTVRRRTTPYYIAKTGVLMLTKIMAEAYEPYGIRVNAISPGVLWTSVARPADLRAKRLANADDIVNALLFLLDPRSSYVNGANIEVAGGWNP